MRPDIAFVHPQYLQAGATPSPAHPIKLVEVGYCSDTKHDIKAAEKREQHKTLMTLLRNQGYKVELYTITLGTTGTLPATTPMDLSELGLDPDTIDTLLHKLHLHSIKHLGYIVAERRRRENLPQTDHG